jgi:hypothetical protein
MSSLPILDKKALFEKLENLRKINSEPEKYHLDLSDVNSIFQYIINHYEKILLLLLIGVIVYCIDHITNINAAIYGVTQIPIPGVASSSSQQNISTKKPKKKSSR